MNKFKRSDYAQLSCPLSVYEKITLFDLSKYWQWDKWVDKLYFIHVLIFLDELPSTKGSFLTLLKVPGCVVIYIAIIGCGNALSFLDPTFSPWMTQTVSGTCIIHVHGSFPINQWWPHLAITVLWCNPWFPPTCTWFLSVILYLTAWNNIHVHGQALSACRPIETL